jgi:abortive infection bacteriophage resistance protein
MKTRYTKACTLPKDLIPLLKRRGLIVSNEQKTENYLANIGYFRLSAYFTQKLKDLLAQYPTIDIRAMGFPDDWQNEPLWR